MIIILRRLAHDLWRSKPSKSIHRPAEDKMAKVVITMALSHVCVNVCVSPGYLEHPFQIRDEEEKRFKCTAHGRGAFINQRIRILCYISTVDWMKANCSVSPDKSTNE